MYDITSYNLGEKLKDIRKAKKITLEELGERIGKVKSTMYKYESGEIVPDIITLQDIANVLEVGLNSFCTLDSDIDEVERSNNTFNVDKLYLYYISHEKLIVSLLEIAEHNNRQNVTLYNAIKGASKECAFKYEGVLESDNEAAFFTLKTMSIKGKFEKVLITIDLKYISNDKYIGSISGTTGDSTPCIKKCMITKEPLTTREELNICFDSVKITENEIEKMKKENYWEIESYNIEEFFIDM